MSGEPFFDRAVVDALAARLARVSDDVGRQVTVMEVCGTHTHAIAAAGLRGLLPPGVRLISGPGCPVCVTPVDYLDRAIALGRRSEVILCTFGDLVRVPASRSSLEHERAHETDVRIVCSPRDALAIARENEDRTVVFLAVGFETTIPGIAAAIAEAEADGVSNFLVLPGGKLIEPPLRALMEDDEVGVDGFLLPGHVSVILGADFYRFVSDEFEVPAAIAGFTPADVMRALVAIVGQIRDGCARVQNLYARAVRPEGNLTAKALMARYFEPRDDRWRGLGTIPASGVALSPAVAWRDASWIPVDPGVPIEPHGCRCGEILKGVIEPRDCPLFAHACSPEHPVGACMVSSEGTCAAWYRHARMAVGGRA